jgi:amidase
MLKDMMATQDAPQIANLRKAGAIVIGRTNSPAFAMRAVTDNSLHGLTLNPWNNNVTCGGSSGGAGASLAAGIGALAQGNDIGGSIRWPSYCNGVAGLRPSVGRVPAFNATATASRAFAAQIMSVNGPMARSVRDLQLGLRVMAKGDPRDPAWIPAPIDPPPLQAPLQVAVAMDETLDPGIKAAMRRAASHLSGAGYEVEEIAPPDIERVAGLWAEIGLTEIAAMLNPVLPNIGDRGILSFISNFWQLKGHGDLARYMAALREREALLTRWQVFMETWPLIILPACSEPSLPVGIDEQGPAQAERLLNALKYQLVLPVLGLPAVALPTGLHNDLPMGIQIMSRKFREDLCLDAAAVIERQEPPITPIDARW